MASFAAEVQCGLAYLRRGLREVRRYPGFYLALTLVLAAPALAAAGLAAAASGRDLGWWAPVALLTLPWITASFGPVVIMVALHDHIHGRTIGFGQALREALFWLPRYLWTNAHTSLIFWVPVGLLLRLKEWQETAYPVPEASGLVAAGLWWLVIALVALGLHTRTVLAPFLAVHSELPATLATLEGWRISGRHFALCLATFVIGSLPVALPLAGLGLALMSQLPPAERATFFIALPNLLLVGIQLVRPVLIPALYFLQEDLWSAELADRAQTGGPPVPAVARTLLALTRPLPRLGRWQA